MCPICPGESRYSLRVQYGGDVITRCAVPTRSFFISRASPFTRTCRGFPDQFKQYRVLGHSWNRSLKVSQTAQLLWQEVGQIDGFLFIDLPYSLSRHRLHSSIIFTKSLNK